MNARSTMQVHKLACILVAILLAHFLIEKYKAAAIDLITFKIQYVKSGKVIEQTITLSCLNSDVKICTKLQLLVFSAVC